MKVILVALPLVLGACSYSPSADVLKALAGDPNSLCWVVTTPWGGATFDRNHGCAGNASASTPIVIVEPLNTPTHVQVVKP